jgi:gamma-glutamyl-gamma-aminobutyrate hydrolase PuuD
VLIPYKLPVNPVVILSMRTNLNNHGDRVSQIEHTWFSFLSELFTQTPLLILVPNLVNAEIIAESLNPSLIVLTGGNDVFGVDNSEDSYEVRDSIEKQLILSNPNTPILGVCRGFQLVNMTLGGSIVQSEGHISKFHELHFEEKSNQGSILNFKTNSFHKWVISDQNLSSDLESIAKANDGTVECAKHRTKPWLLTMWHPERTNPGEFQRDWVIEYLRSLILQKGKK